MKISPFLPIWLLVIGTLCHIPYTQSEYINKYGAVTSHSRFAYVMLHYEGTPADDEYLLGLRVLIKSIQISDTSNDIVVLLSNNVRASTRQQLLSDNVIIDIIDNIPNPFKSIDGTRSRTYKPRFEYTFNKLYLWSMIQYERVIYMDSDNIVLYNIDHLFACGHFCVIFMNPLLFHTGLMVIKPNTLQYNTLLHNLQDIHSYSYDGADQGFLVSQFDVEDAVLFNPSSIQYDINNNNSIVCNELVEQRLTLQYNLNHFYYYPSMSYTFFSRSNYYFSNYTIPALTLAYPAAPWLKPWYWYPIFFFTQHIHWHHVRDNIHDLSYIDVLVTRMILLCVVYCISNYIVRPSLHRPSMESYKSMFQSIIKKQIFFIGYGIGVPVWLMTSYVTFQLIPATCAPLIAFTTFIILHINFLFIILTNYTLLLRNKYNNNIKINNKFNYTILCIAQLMCGVFFLPLYPHFIPKVAVVVFGLFYWCVIQAHMFKKTAQILLDNNNK